MGEFDDPRRLVEEGLDPGGKVLPASPEHPVYTKIRQDGSRNLWMITCDEGWRTSIMCIGMYERPADWLIGVLDRRPYAPEPTT